MTWRKFNHRGFVAGGFAMAASVAECVGCTAVLLPGLCGDRDDDDVTEETYFGSDSCAAYHGQIFDRFRNNGHPDKINKLVNGQMPTNPFGSIAGALQLYNDDSQQLVAGSVDV